MSDTYINVKLPPYNAAGDGVTDDYAAIAAAINDAAGRTVYFPAGTYMISATLPTSTSPLLGDDSMTAGLRAIPNAVQGYMIVLGPSSSMSNLFVDGNLPAHSQPIPVLSGVSIVGRDVVVNRCRIANFSRIGIAAVNVLGTVVRQTGVFNTASYNLWLSGCPRSLITECELNQSGQANILIFNSPQSRIVNNKLTAAGPVGAGIYWADSDDTVISGNIISRARAGIEADETPTRPNFQYSFGVAISGNVIHRNYNTGISIALVHGTSITGNIISYNGHGGMQSNEASTIEPGIKVDPSFPGSGYQVGDILTLVGGIGTPAEVLVAGMFTGGTLYDTPGADVALYPLSMGNYFSFPSNPVAVSGGLGTGAKVIYTNSRIGAAGSGYVRGQILEAIGGTFIQRVRINVTSVGDGGSVSGYEIVDGGGYTGALPSALGFANLTTAARYSGGSGFTLIPAWGQRYSRNYLSTGGLTTLGPCTGLSIVGNQIVGNTGPGLLFGKLGAPYNGRTNRSVVTGNIFRDNDYTIKGQTGAGPLDDTWPSSNKIDLNIGYPKL